MRILVVGAGIAGSTFTRMARSRDHDVKLIDAGSPASAVALAAVRRSWAPKEDRHLVDYALAWYASNGWLVTDEAIVTNQKGEHKVEKDWNLVKPMAPLLPPDERRELELGDLFHTDHVLLATGAACGGKFNYGTTAQAKVELPFALQVLHIRAYHSVLVASYGGWTRVGSSKAMTQADADMRLMGLVGSAEEAGLVPRNITWELMRGRRAVAGPDRIQRDDLFWSLGNYGRMGYSYAPADAAAVLNLMEAAG